MSQKISEMNLLSVPVGTEHLPAVTASGQNVKIPISALQTSNAVNNVPYVLKLFSPADFMPTSFEGSWVGEEEVSVNLCTWDEYAQRIIFTTPGIYDIKLVTRLDCLDNGSATSWPDMDLAIGVGLRNIFNVGYTGGYGSATFDMRENMHSAKTGLLTTNSQSFFQWSDSFLMNTTIYDDSGPNWTSPFVSVYSETNNAEAKDLGISMLFIANLITPLPLPSM